MPLCGWKRREMFDRYNIVDLKDLARAVERRFGGNGKDAANYETPAQVTTKLSCCTTMLPP